MHTGTPTSRRSFLYLTGSLAAGIALPAIPSTLLASDKKEGEQKEADVNPVEDLMREHGVLRRILLIYEEALNRMNKGKNVPSGVIGDSADIIRRFVEDYHEKLEEQELFPRLEKAGKLNELVRALFEQHQAGRRLTDSILKLTGPEAPRPKPVQDSSAAVNQIYGGTPLFQRFRMGSTGKLTVALEQFIHMYRPHAAREDTVLFPAFRSIVSPGEFDELGEKFEDRERALFGREGFEGMVESVGEIERKLGIHELSKFTPSV